MTTQKRTALVILALLIVLIGASVWFLYASFQHQKDDIALIAAIQKKDVAGVKTLLNRGADPNSIETHGPPPSVWQLCRDFLDRLRGKGTQPKQDGPCALVLAVESGKAEVVKALLSEGATRVNAVVEAEEVDDITVSSPLLVYASQHDDAQMVQALLDKGASVNRKTYQGVTALIAAAPVDKGKVVSLLLDKGADANARDDYGETALLAALMQEGENSAVARILVNRGANVNLNDEDGYTPLMWAKSIEIARLLLDKGANIHARVSEGKESGSTPLLFSAERMPVLKLLLSRGSDIHETNDNDVTCLMRVAEYGDASDVRFVLRQDTNVNATSINGWTALMYAASDAPDDDHDNTLKVLIGAGADVNARNVDGETALMIVAIRGHNAGLRALLKAGARVNARDDDGKTALDYAIDSCDTVGIALLKQAGGRK